MPGLSVTFKYTVHLAYAITKSKNPSIMLEFGQGMRRLALLGGIVISVMSSTPVPYAFVYVIKNFFKKSSSVMLTLDEGKMKMVLIIGLQNRPQPVAKQRSNIRAPCVTCLCHN